jgi:hypothetical protein
MFIATKRAAALLQQKEVEGTKYQARNDKFL